MKLCQECWNKLKQAVDERGLSNLIAKNGEVAASQIAEQLTTGSTPTNYDPLMAANMAIWSESLRAFGLSMMAEDAPCPLCEKTRIESICIDLNCSKQTGDDWIQFAAEDQLQYAIHMGYVPKPS
jgi:hypothetical protein